MRVGVIGLGIMGSAMAYRLIQAGHQVFVYNRTEEKAKPLLDAGANWRKSPAEVASDSDTVITIVTNGQVLEEVTFAANGVLAGLPTSTIHCDMSTIAPSDATKIARRYKESDHRYIQAPVLGSKLQIEQGVLLVLAGDETDIDQCTPAFNAFSKRIWHFATHEQSAVTKLACNMLIAQMIVGLGQSLALAAEAGVSGTTMLEIIGDSAMANTMYAWKGKAIIEGNFAANFAVKNLLKDLRLASDYASQNALPLPANAINRELFVKAISGGLGDEDYSAVVKLIMARYAV